MDELQDSPITIRHLRRSTRIHLGCSKLITGYEASFAGMEIPTFLSSPRPVSGLVVRSFALSVTAVFGYVVLPFSIVTCKGIRRRNCRGRRIASAGIVLWAFTLTTSTFWYIQSVQLGIFAKSSASCFCIDCRRRLHKFRPIRRSLHLHQGLHFSSRLH